MRPRVLLFLPAYGWSFHNIAKNISRHLADRFDFSIKTIKEVVPGEPYDLTVSLLWTNAERLRIRLGDRPKSIACLFDHASTGAPLGRELFTRMARNVHGVVVGSPALIDLATGLGARSVTLCQDGVDGDLFRPLPLPPTFTVGWCGNISIGDGTYKGLNLIEEASKRAGVPLVVQTFEQKIPQVDMPARFYSRISAYICASIQEGTPNPVLEALSCGRPVISTRVGIVDQVLRDGVNGLFVDRTVDAIAEAIREVQGWGNRSAACRSAVSAWGWEATAERWGEAFDSALAATQHDLCCAAQ